MLVALIAAVYVGAWLNAGPTHQRYVEVRTNSYETIDVYVHSAGSKPPKIPKTPNGPQLVTELRNVSTRADWQFPLAITIAAAGIAAAIEAARRRKPKRRRAVAAVLIASAGLAGGVYLYAGVKAASHTVTTVVTWVPPVYWTVHTRAHWQATVAGVIAVLGIGVGTAVSNRRRPALDASPSPARQASSAA